MLLIALSLTGAIVSWAIGRRGKQVLSLAVLVATALVIVYLADRWHLSIDGGL